MNLRDQFISAFDSILLALLVMWTATFVSALVYPQAASTERIGTVEIYAIARADAPGA